MDFAFSSEQQQLRDSLQRYIEREYPLPARRAHARSALGYSADTWRALAQMGVLGISLPGEYGGFDGSGVDTMLVMEAIGRGLLLEPYVPTAVMAASALQMCGTAAQQASWLPRIAGGDVVMAFACNEAAGRHDWRYVTTRAQRSDSGYKLLGAKAVVLHGGQAQQLIVVARTSGEASDQHGLSLFLVDPRAAGVTLRDYATIDGLRAAEVTLNNVSVGADALLGTEGGAFEVIDAIMDRANAALCAEALGAMNVLHEMTLEYLKTRRQFGVPIGTFQVLQHRIVDVFIHLEQARSLTYYAAFHAHSTDAAQRRRAVSAAKVQVADAARFVSQQCIQMHGGMGMTDELAVGHYVKRITMIASTFGNLDTHLERFASLA